MTTNDKKPAAVSATITDEGTLVMAFAGVEVFTVYPDAMPVEIQRRAMLHGFSAKLVDAAAISRNPDTGRAATVGDKQAAVMEVYERLCAGRWNKGREAGTGGSATGGLLLGALMSIYPKQSREKLDTWLKSLSKDQVSALRLDTKVAAKIAELKAARAKEEKGPVDVAGLLGELETGE